MQSRLAQLREALQRAELDAIVITHPANRRYLTGFEADDTPPNESGGHVVISAERAVLIVGPLETSRAHEQAVDFEIFDRVRPLAKADATVLSEIGAKRVGFEEDVILYFDYVTLRENLDTDTVLVAVGNLELPPEFRKAILSVRSHCDSMSRCANSARAGHRSRPSSPLAPTRRSRTTSRAIGVSLPESRSSSTWAPWLMGIVPI